MSELEKLQRQMICPDLQDRLTQRRRAAMHRQIADYKRRYPGSIGEFRSEYPAQGKRIDQLAFSALVLLGAAVIGIATGLTLAIWNLL